MASEDTIKSPDNWWTSDAVKAWECKCCEGCPAKAELRDDGKVWVQERSDRRWLDYQWTEATLAKPDMDHWNLAYTRPATAQAEPAPTPPVAEPPITNNDDDGNPDPKMEMFWKWVKDIKATAVPVDAPPAPPQPATHVWDTGKQMFVPLNPQHDPDQLTRGEFLTLLLACEADLRSLRPNREDYLAEAVEMAVTTERKLLGSPAFVAAWKGRRA
jgi:hypothetical protein